MPPRTKAQRRRIARARRRARTRRVRAHVGWRRVPNALRDWADLSSAERTATATKALVAAAALVLVVVGWLVGVAFHGAVIERPATPVATVDGEPIPASRYAEFLALRRFELGRLLAETPPLSQVDDPNHPQAQLATLTIGAVTELSNLRLMRTEAEALGITADDAAIDAELDEFVRGPGELPDDFEFEAAFADVRERTQLSAETIRGFMADRALADAVARHLAADLDQAPAQVRASQILTPSEEAAETAAAQLDALQPFALVAEQVSQDADSAADGGDLGWLPRGVMPEAWDEAAFALRAGVRSRPVATPLGWHLILVHEHAESRPLDAAAAERRRQATYTAWLDDLRTAADVQFLLTPEIVDWARRELPDQAAAPASNRQR